jgi:hypothetical protein
MKISQSKRFFQEKLFYVAPRETQVELQQIDLEHRQHGVNF